MEIFWKDVNIRPAKNGYYVVQQRNRGFSIDFYGGKWVGKPIIYKELQAFEIKPFEVLTFIDIWKYYVSYNKYGFQRRFIILLFDENNQIIPTLLFNKESQTKNSDFASWFETNKDKNLKFISFNYYE